MSGAVGQDVADGVFLSALPLFSISSQSDAVQWLTPVFSSAPAPHFPPVSGHSTVSASTKRRTSVKRSDLPELRHLWHRLCRQHPLQVFSILSCQVTAELAQLLQLSLQQQLRQKLSRIFCGS